MKKVFCRHHLRKLQGLWNDKWLLRRWTPDAVDSPQEIDSARPSSARLGWLPATASFGNVVTSAIYHQEGADLMKHTDASAICHSNTKPYRVGVYERIQACDSCVYSPPAGKKDNYFYCTIFKPSVKLYRWRNCSIIDRRDVGTASRSHVHDCCRVVGGSWCVTVNRLTWKEAEISPSLMMNDDLRVSGCMWLCKLKCWSLQSSCGAEWAVVLWVGRVKLAKQSTNPANLVHNSNSLILMLCHFVALSLCYFAWLNRKW